VNKKKFYLFAILLVVSFDSIGQQAWKNISISSAFSFSQYNGDIQNTLPGFQLRLGYSIKRSYVTFGFEHGLKSATDSMWSSRASLRA